MKPPRGLSEKEAALWSQVTASVKPIHGDAPPKSAPDIVPPPPSRQPKAVKSPPSPSPLATLPPKVARSPASKSRGPAVTVTSPAAPKFGEGLDSTWDRKLARNGVSPDFTLDLHGHTLETAHQRLDWGLTQAKAMGARVVLVITGKPRRAEAADRAERRGAIRSKILDWLAAGAHSSDIAAIRNAHRRHGGSGALYIILRRRR
ncbi:DNA mismatch repair protein MutS [Altericroceibacterium spongiae]|uniref:DNA mismatch repair protein MutS n=1 Tax=Altericroceibacterium spongiae TaxID=2320269 RepID=A0A420ELR1_9SPHN|nr:Smr/MutS family protein [Altericroceibacterium spongiae]RKF21657.1 DNA mismatch repair protein MutS [Altericroceibacterium spongiae]